MARRYVRIESEDDVTAEARWLARRGYAPGGNWDLAQVCRHLADWLRFSMDGYPKGPLPVRPMLWLVRNTLGGVFLRNILRAGAMPQGSATMSQTVHAPAQAPADEAAAVEELARTLERWKGFTGPVARSPLFGALDRETARRLHLIHCAHHLSYLIPRDPDPGPRAGTDESGQPQPLVN